MNATDELNEITEADEIKTYEVGFLLSPMIPTEQLPEAVEKHIKTAIVSLSETSGGEIVSEGPIGSVALAFPIKRLSGIGGKRVTFREAFFGSVRFHSQPAAIAALGVIWQETLELIRHLIIEITPADLAHEKRTQIQQKRVAAAAVKPVLSAAEMDKEIDQLLIEQ